jgi:hypothetical protein
MKKVYRVGMHFQRGNDIYVLAVIDFAEDDSPVVTLINIQTGARLNSGIGVANKEDISFDEFVEICGVAYNNLEEVLVNFEIVDRIVDFGEVYRIVKTNSLQGLSLDNYLKIERYCEQEAKRRKYEG